MGTRGAGGVHALPCVWPLKKKLDRDDDDDEWR